MIPGLFNNLALCSNKLLSTIEEAKNDAADFILSQLYPQTFITDLQQHQSNMMTQSSSNTQSIYPSPTNSTNTTNSPQSPIASIQQQQQQAADLAYATTMNTVNRPEYLPALIGAQQPQFIFDPTGQYLLCPTAHANWQ